MPAGNRVRFVVLRRTKRHGATRSGGAGAAEARRRRRLSFEVCEFQRIGKADRSTLVRNAPGDGVFLQPAIVPAEVRDLGNALERVGTPATPRPTMAAVSTTQSTVTAPDSSWAKRLRKLVMSFSLIRPGRAWVPPGGRCPRDRGGLCADGLSPRLPEGGESGARGPHSIGIRDGLAASRGLRPPRGRGPPASPRAPASGRGRPCRGPPPPPRRRATGSPPPAGARSRGRTDRPPPRRRGTRRRP